MNVGRDYCLRSVFNLQAEEGNAVENEINESQVADGES
jgi:hypothetical protein